MKWSVWPPRRPEHLPREAPETSQSYADLAVRVIRLEGDVARVAQSLKAIEQQRATWLAEYLEAMDSLGRMMKRAVERERHQTMRLERELELRDGGEDDDGESPLTTRKRLGK